MTPGARVQAAIELLDDILATRVAADVARESYFRRRRYAGAADRRRITERLYAVLRSRARLAWWIARGGPTLATARQLTIADLALREHLDAAAIAACFDGGRHSPAPPDAAEAALASFLAGRTLDHPAMPEPVRLEYPPWLDDGLRAGLGTRFAEEMRALNAPASLDLRVNALKGDVARAREVLAGEGITAAPTPFSPWGLRIHAPVRVVGTTAFRRGLVEIQDEGSQLVALLVGARPGMTVIDLCAGAGGKTLALAATMAAGGAVVGRLIAADVDAGRLARMSPRMRRAGVRGLERVRLEGDGEPASLPLADRVLVDAPCSGTGTWRRRPEARWHLAPDEVAQCVARQDRLLDQAARLVRPRGRVVYATCSLLADENEERIAAFLARDDAFARLPAAIAWNESLSAPWPGTGEMLRLSPATTGTDGFFVAILERRR